MKEPVLKDMLYGSIKELLNNEKFFYRSSIGGRYSHLSKEGEEAFAQMFTTFLPLIVDAENEALVEKGKKMILSGLKGETN